jgi:acetyl-CoA carboxylase carboxyltransferase component
LGYIDKVVFPDENLPLISMGLDMLVAKRQSRPPKKFGNIAL